MATASMDLPRQIAPFRSFAVQNRFSISRRSSSLVSGLDTYLRRQPQHDLWNRTGIFHPFHSRTTYIRQPTSHDGRPSLWLFYLFNGTIWCLQSSQYIPPTRVESAYVTPFSHSWGKPVTRHSNPSPLFFLVCSLTSLSWEANTLKHFLVVLLPPVVLLRSLDLPSQWGH